MADRLLPAVGTEVSALGVARHHGALLDGWVLDQRDADLADRVRALGLACAVTDTMMDEVAVAAALAATCLELADRIRAGRST
jgi:LPPG:FO 2-phospho-L-lactate transferase